MTLLRWKKKNNSDTEIAYSGDLSIGAIGTRSADPSRWWYDATWAVHMRYIAKGSGEVASRAAARRAVERAWAKWLELVKLAPVDATGVRFDCVRIDYAAEPRFYERFRDGADALA